jgi:hypothetical protein
MPDGSSTINASYIHHRRVVVIACPDPHNEIAGVTYCPVITELV